MRRKGRDEGDVCLFVRMLFKTGLVAWVTMAPLTDMLSGIREREPLREELSGGK